MIIMLRLDEFITEYKRKGITDFNIGVWPYGSDIITDEDSPIRIKFKLERVK